jgi:drug/metabolite transporter (DMT)-like permease
MNPPAADSSSAPSPGMGRLYIALAALLWSTGGAFTKVLTKDTFLGLNDPVVNPLQIACLRALFATLVLLPTVRRKDISFRPSMVAMVISFAIMNASFISALALGTAAKAIVLQYTAPMWMYLASVWWLGEQADRKNLAALLIGIVGIGVIFVGGWQHGQLPIVGIGLVSGLSYAGVLIFLRVLRDVSSRWLTVVNHLFGGLILIPLVVSMTSPSPAQFVVLFFYGGLQMGLPYWLVARGLRSVSPQEAGTITLLEPILNPIWAYLVASEVPSMFEWIGGAFILGALAWRYWPRNLSASPITGGSPKRGGK